MEVSDTALRMVLEDDGQGLSPEPRPGRGNGLRNINHRLDQIGGTCIIASAAKGARVDLTIPLPPA